MISADKARELANTYEQEKVGRVAATSEKVLNKIEIAIRNAAAAGSRRLTHEDVAVAFRPVARDLLDDVSDSVRTTLRKHGFKTGEPSYDNAGYFSVCWHTYK